MRWILGVLLVPALAFGTLLGTTDVPPRLEAVSFLLIPDGDQLQVHLDLRWSGPAAPMAWVMPVPVGTEVRVGSEATFERVELVPEFLTNGKYDECEPDDGDSYPPCCDSDACCGGQAERPPHRWLASDDAQVVQPPSAQALRTLLEAAGYRVPAAADTILASHLAEGQAFLIVRLPVVNPGDTVLPMILTMPAGSLRIPLRLLSQGARPDLPVAVQVLGPARAVPLNFRHVEINDALLDWTNYPSGYEDVASQAIDEAGGEAFVTDLTGPVGAAWPEPVPEEALAAVEADPVWATYRDHIYLFEDLELDRVYRMTMDQEGAGRSGEDNLRAIVRHIREEVNPARQALRQLRQTHPRLTRLFTTVNPGEPRHDPTFGFNPDLPQDIEWLRYATATGPCGGPWQVVTPSGRRYRTQDGHNPNRVVRRDGQTVRGGHHRAAAVIQQLTTAGSGQTISPSEGGCRTGGGAPGWSGWVLVALYVGRRRRR